MSDWEGTICAHKGCYATVEQSDVGRPRKYCSPECGNAERSRRSRERERNAGNCPTCGQRVPGTRHLSEG